MPKNIFRPLLDTIFQSLSKELESELKLAGLMKTSHLGKILSKAAMLIKHFEAWIQILNKISKEYFVSDIKIGK
jgi:hypothetical protein